MFPRTGVVEDIVVAAAIPSLVAAVIAVATGYSIAGGIGFVAMVLNKF